MGTPSRSRSVAGTPKHEIELSTRSMPLYDPRNRLRVPPTHYASDDLMPNATQNLTVGHIQDLPGDRRVSEGTSGVYDRLIPAREPASADQEIADLVAEKVIAVLRKLSATQPRLLSIRDAATYLACSKRSVESMVAACEIPTVRRGGHPRIDIRDLDVWIEKYKTEAA